MSPSNFKKIIIFLSEIKCFRVGRADLPFPGQDRVNGLLMRRRKMIETFTKFYYNYPEKDFILLQLTYLLNVFSINVYYYYF